MWLEEIEAIGCGAPPLQVAQILAEQMVQVLDGVRCVRLEGTGVTERGVPLRVGTEVHAYSNKGTESCGDNMTVMKFFCLNRERSRGREDSNQRE